MNTHYEVIAKYLADRGWVRNPKRNAEDCEEDDLDIQTFLNVLVTQTESQQETEATTSRERERRVRFELNVENTPANSQPSGPNRCKAAPTQPITTTKTFPEGNPNPTDPSTTITVPWPNQPSLGGWYAIPTILQHTINTAITTHCAPWSWLHSPAEPSTQPWYHANMYAPIALSATLTTLHRHTQLLLCPYLPSLHKSFTSALRTTTALSTALCTTTWTRDDGDNNITHIRRLRRTHATMVTNLFGLFGQATEMLRVIATTKTGIWNLGINPQGNAPSPAITLAAQAPALLAALEALEAGMGELVDGALGYVAGVIGTAGQVVEGVMKRLEEGGEGEELEGVWEWYEETWEEVVELGQMVGFAVNKPGVMKVGDPWERILEMERVVERGEEGLERVCEVMRGLEVGAKVMTGKMV